MPKCIVCNKSAGIFYSLHKSCYQIYEDTKKSLRQIVSTSFYTSDIDEVIEALYACRPKEIFSPYYYTKLLIHIWEEEAINITKSFNSSEHQASCLLQIAEKLGIEQKDVETSLFGRLEHIKYIQEIQNNNLISKTFDEKFDELEFDEDEKITWVFNNAGLEEERRYSQEKSYSIFKTVLDSTLLRSRYKTLSTYREDAGRLIVTNKNLYYLKNNKQDQIEIQNIYSVTPMRDGIKIQSKSRNSMPKTFITGDGRFTYCLLGYVQENLS